MNWHAIGAIGQILGSLATFVTVGYLVVQVHDAEREMKRSIAQSRAERNIELNLGAATSERLAEIHAKGNLALVVGTPPTPHEAMPPQVVEAMKSAPPLIAAATTRLGFTPSEIFMLSAEQSARWNNTSYTLLYVDELPPGEREQFDRTTRGFFSEPLVRFWFDLSKSSFSPDAVRYVENLLAQPS
jgi:hypothetical protein